MARIRPADERAAAMERQIVEVGASFNIFEAESTYCADHRPQVVPPANGRLMLGKLADSLCAVKRRGQAVF